jgi:hypothetical protein
VALAAARPPSPALIGELVGEMTASLGASAGLVAVFTDETQARVRTMAALLDGSPLAPFEYALAGTPCEQVVGPDLRHVERGLAKKFRGGSLFATEGMDSYAAYPLCDSQGERLRLLAAMDREPFADVALAEAVLKIIGSGIAAELERSTTEGLFEASGKGVPITAMEYELLRVFLASPNRVLSRDQLLMKTRNRQWEPFDRSIDIRIGRLRKKIEPDPAAEPRCIRTVRSAGYMDVPD